MGPGDAAVVVALRDLSARYALGADRRDTELFLSAFHADAVVVVEGREGLRRRPAHRLEGLVAIARIVDLLGAYERTFHLVGEGRFVVEDHARATGDVPCHAHHHLRRGDDLVDRVMFLHYRDRYAASPDGTWRIAERVVQVDWTEDRVVTDAVGDVADDPGGPP